MNAYENRISPTRVTGISICGLFALSLVITPVPAAAVNATTSESSNTKSEPTALSNFDLKESLNIPELENVKLDFTNVEAKGTRAEFPYLEKKSQSTKTLAIARLNNKSDIEQTLNSQSETRTSTNKIEVKSSQTSGIGIGLTAEGKFNALLLETTSGFNASFNGQWSWETTHGNESQVSWVLPPQSIKVPAKSTVLVTANLVETKFTGKMVTSTDLVGNVIATGTCNTPLEIPIGQLLALQNDQGSFVYPTDAVTVAEDTATVSSTMDISGEMGTQFSVVVEASTPNTTEILKVENIRSTIPETDAPAETERVKRSILTSPFHGTTFSSLAAHLNCTKSTFGTFDLMSTDHTSTHFDGEINHAFVGGGYFLSKQNELFKDNVSVATNVSSAKGYLSHRGGKWRSLVDYVTLDGVGHVNHGSKNIKTIHGLPKDAEPIGSSYFTVRIGGEKNRYLLYLEGIRALKNESAFSPVAWEDEKGAAVSFVTGGGRIGMVSNGIQLQTFTINSTLDVNTLRDSIKVLPGGVFRLENSFVHLERVNSTRVKSKDLVVSPLKIADAVTYYVPSAGVWSMDWVGVDPINEESNDGQVKSFDLATSDTFATSRPISVGTTAILNGYETSVEKSGIFSFPHNKTTVAVNDPHVWIEDDSGRVSYSYTRAPAS